MDHETLRAGLRRELLAWDPIGCSPPEDEYDCLIAPLLKRLESGCNAEFITRFLDHEIQHHFGMNPEPCRTADFAQRLCAWYGRMMSGVNPVAMERVERAVAAIRHAVQDHGDEQTRIGAAGDPDRARWLASRLGITLPPSYLEVLKKHDGALVELPLYSLMESVEVLSLHREGWPTAGLWPVAGDGCGNTYVLSTSHRLEGGESPVGFVEAMTDPNGPSRWVASSYATFVLFFMAHVCAGRGCSALLRSPSRQAWPLDPDFVARVDPEMEDVRIRCRLP